jgi:hypothetical protein
MLHAVATVDARDIFTRCGKIDQRRPPADAPLMRHVKALGYACFCNNGRSSRTLPTRSIPSTRSIS